MNNQHQHLHHYTNNLNKPFYLKQLLTNPTLHKSTTHILTNIQKILHYHPHAQH
jgi:hypothetical protein